MKKITLLIATLTLSVGSIFAQGSNTIPSNNHSQTSTYDRVETSTERCSTDEVMKALRDKDPVAYDAQEALKEQQYQDWIKNEYPKFKSSKKAVITIPVVVQIWETTGTVPDTRVTQQINRLNLDFRGANSDISNTPSVFPTADSEIEFCLATRDPSGNPTTGIIRRTPGGSPPSSGGTEMWDPTKYLNIYVYNIGGGTLGFTYLSSQSPNQAVHVTTGAFGNTVGQFGMGRTATHEIGHWLNLQHIWGNGSCGNDFVNDTPPAQNANYNCPSHPHDVGVCSGNTNGEMFMNYMDYVNDACMYAFTPGQKARMIAAINNDRPGLLTSNGCQATTGEKELLKDINEILVFPNPTNGTLNVALTAKENTSVDIYNVVGKLIYSSGIKNTQLFTIDINNQPNGVYFVNIKSGNSVTTKKVLLSK